MNLTEFLSKLEEIATLYEWTVCKPHPEDSLPGTLRARKPWGKTLLLACPITAVAHTTHRYLSWDANRADDVYDQIGLTSEIAEAIIDAADGTFEGSAELRKQLLKAVGLEEGSYDRGLGAGIPKR